MECFFHSSFFLSFFLFFQMSEASSLSTTSQKSSESRRHHHHHHHHHHPRSAQYEGEVPKPPEDGKEEELDEQDYMIMQYEAERKAQLAIIEIIYESEERKTDAKAEIFRRKIIEVHEKYDKAEKPFIDELRRRGLL